MKTPMTYPFPSRILCVILLLSFSLPFIFGQSVGSNTGSIVIFRPKQFMSMGRTPGVLCDGQRVADLTHRRYFTLKLTPGQHKISDTWGNHIVTLKVEANQTYYLEFNLNESVVLRNMAIATETATGVEITDPRELINWWGFLSKSEKNAKSQIEKLKPIDTKKVRNPGIVSTDMIVSDGDLTGASINGNVEKVKLLLKANADANARDYNGSTALIAVSANKHKEVVELLLKANADANARDYNGSTALIAASKNKHKEVVELLLKAKAEVNANANGHNGTTALIEASKNKHKEVVELLRKAGAVE
jgi:hypothetical protein